MIPLRDDVPSRTFPIVTIGLIVANVAAFVLELGQGPHLERFVRQAAVIPALFTGADHELSLGEVFYTSINPALASRVLVAMFLHGGFLHLIGNMLYLWI